MMKNLNKIILSFLVLCLGFLFISCIDEGDDNEIDTTDYTEEFKLLSDYENKSFLDDGIGKVILTQKVDGDTAHFKDLKKNYTFTARFLLINTPESTGFIQAWGREASLFVADILKSAYEIICESEVLNSPAVTDSTGKRYLAFVWYRTSETADFRLLNLEIIEESYSRYDEKESRYSEVFAKAYARSYKLGKRYLGERDPNFDYSTDVDEISIAYLRNNYAELSNNGKKFRITAKIIRTVGNNLYVEDLEEYIDDKTGERAFSGIYVYAGYSHSFGLLTCGTVLTFTCKAADDDVFGIQLTDISNVVNEYWDPITPRKTFSGEDIIDLKDLEGEVIKLTNAKITGVGNVDSDTNAFTVYLKTGSGQNLNVRIDGGVSPKLSYTDVQNSIGKNVSVTGGVSKFNDSFQIMLGNYTTQFLKDFEILN